MFKLAWYDMSRTIVNPKTKFVVDILLQYKVMENSLIVGGGIICGSYTAPATTNTDDD